MSARHGISLTNRGELVVAGGGFAVTLMLTPDELRDMAGMLIEVAAHLEDQAAGAATAALDRAARGPLQ